MGKARKRSVQTCSLCEKTGHNKRRCSLRDIQKSSTQSVETQRKTRVTKRQLPRVIRTESVSQTRQNKKKKKEKTTATKHYVPVAIGKTTSHSDHIIDLSNNADVADPSWESIQSFREQLAETVERRTIDFAMAVRNEKRTENKKRIPIQRKNRVRMPSMRIPNVRLPKLRFSFPNIVRSRFPHIQIPSLHIPIKRFAPVMFVLVALVALPIPAFSSYKSIKAHSAQVVSASTHAFVSLHESTTAAFQADTETAQFALQDALAAFAEVESMLEKDYKMLTDIVSALPVIGDHVSGRRAIVTAGQHIALGNTYVIKGVNDAQTDGDMPMTNRLAILTSHMEQALPQYEEARRALVSVNSNILPTEQRVVFEEFLLLYSTFIDDIQDLTDLSHVLYDVFGGDSFRRYLVLFQNHHEIRPTGGFIGSFAVLDTQKGRIEHIDIPGGGSYDIQGQLDTYIVPPEPLQLVNKRWELQDSNWFYDFSATARKAESFVASARGTTFDGTIAVNASVIERVLRIIGPVSPSEYDVLLDAESILPTLQHHVEDGYTKHEDEAPKEILSDVLDTLLDAMQSIEPDQLMLLLRELHDALSEKEIQVSLKHPASHARIASFGWTGEISETDARQDYVAVVAANLQGQKSDARIEQEITHQADVQEDGSVIVRVGVTRTHTGSASEAHYGAQNIAFMRLYTPEGSVLLDAGGFTYPPETAFKVPELWYTEDVDVKRIEQEVGIHKQTGTRITNEFGKTAFGNWMVVQPGESREIWFTYRLPFSVVDKKRTRDGMSNIFASQPDAISRYSLVIQKQSGVQSTFTSSIEYPYGWIPRWKSTNEIDFSLTGAQVETDLDTDAVYGIVLEQRL